MVYAAAQRMVQESHAAEGITQSVFTTLAKKADSINPSEVLARWLHDTTRRLAAHTSATAATPAHEVGAGRVVNDLETMMDRLPPADRDAIVLHYLEKRSLRDVAEILHLSEEAAHARVSHAVEQLHARFNEKGVPIASAVLATVLSSECAAHVPIGLAIAVGTEALDAAATVPVRPSPGTWSNGKTAAAVLVVALVVATGVFLRQNARVNELKSENARLLVERKKLRTENALGRPSVARAGNVELVRLRRSEDELLRLRREVALWRKQAETATPPAPPPEPPPPVVIPADPHDPGRFIGSEELRFAGYSTPEAAMESIVWCMLAGSYDAFLTALGPEDRAEELNYPEGREFFEARQQQLAPQFKSMQVAALKVLSDDEVEVKVLLDFGSPLFHIQPLVRVNEQWRLSNSTRDYDSDWDSDGDIQRFTTGR